MDFATHCGPVARRIETAYGIAVITRDVPDPLIGDLNGREIHIDHAISPEERLFLLAHLFGHTVQWNVNPQAWELGKLHQPPVDPELLPSILAYEREAAAYGLTLLHEAGVDALDRWFANYTACDMAYLEHYYRTGERREFRSFWREEVALFVPLGIPPFFPSERRFRGNGLVI